MAFSLKDFDGEIPKLEPHNLPNSSAQLAANCDFSSQSLAPALDGELLGTMANNPVKGMYTEDGLLFYTWNVETFAFRSPILGDTYQRMYFLTPSEGLLRVATKLAMAVNGPTPPASFKAGVPRPVIAPVLKTVELTALPDYPNVSVTATIWWDYNGTRYSQQAIGLTTAAALKDYTFAAPAYPAGAPAGVVPQLGIELKILDQNNSSAVLVQLNAKTGTNGRSQGLPGGVELQLTVDSSGGARARLYWGIARTSAYTYTFENIWGEESAPAPPATIACSYLQAVQVGTTAADFTGYQAYSKTNIYRTYGTSNAYLKTTVTGGGPYVDASTTPDTVGGVLETTSWLPPPAALAGACATTQGWLAAFSGSTLYASESARPHAWPYSMLMPSAVRSVIEIEGGLVVTCADGVYFGAGLTPDAVIASMTPMKLPQPGIAQRSITSVDGGAAYISNDGIPVVLGARATMDASQKLFTRKKWRNMYKTIVNDASIRLAYFDGAIIATSHTQALGFTVRLDENVGQFSRANMRVDATFQVAVNDALYYSVGANVYRYAAGNPLTYDWWSKDFISPHEESMGAAYIRTSGPVTLMVYADGLLWDTMTVDTGFFRFAPILARRWSVRLQGTATVYELKVARTFQELKNVV